MSLDEVRVLLRFKDSPHENCGDVNAVLDEHIEHVSRRIKELRALGKGAQGAAGTVQRRPRGTGVRNSGGLARERATPKRQSPGHLKGVHGKA